MRLIGFVEDGVRHVGTVKQHQVRDLGRAADFYHAPRQALHATDGRISELTELTQAPPVPETARIFCVGVNYRSHAQEAKSLADIDAPDYPIIFGRWQQTLVVDGDPVPVPPNETGLDWEVELAAVIGSKTWAAREETALDHVLGYTVFNDLSARTKQTHTSQFTLGKNADDSGPIGPVIVAADEIGDASALNVEARVNGQVMQRANTRDLIHGLGRIIEYITDTVTLLPGDVIATGTPGGIGASRNPPVFLVPGDVVEVEVEKIGTVRNPIVAADGVS